VNPNTETIMQRAFLLALLKWAARAHRGKPIAVPTGRVDPSELVRVVTGLKCAASSGARRRRESRRNHQNRNDFNAETVVLPFDGFRGFRH
jgi:hypothetical protein